MEDEIAGAGEKSSSNVTSWCWWALASSAQLAWGVSSYRKGFPGDSHLMPFKAFGVASLFVGSAASASIAALRASDIKKVEDLLLVGANLRSRLGISRRGHEKRIKLSKKIKLTNLIKKLKFLRKVLPVSQIMLS